MNDCIAFALPCVANAHLAEAMEAPTFVHRISDNISAVLLAEALTEVFEKFVGKRRPVEPAAAYKEAHSFSRYSELMLQALGLESRGAR